MPTNSTSSASLCVTAKTLAGYEGFIGGFLVHIPYYLLLYAIIVQRRAFHPFFGLSFGAFLVSYIVIGIVIQIMLFFKYIGVPTLMEFFGDCTNFMYYFILPINLTCALERFFATIFYKDYEKRRPWIALGSAWFIALAFGLSLQLWQPGGFLSTVVQFAMYGGSVASLLICVGVIIANFYMTKKISVGKGKESLTARYQLTENIKAVHIILPFILIDNLITFLELSWTVLYRTETSYDDAHCQKDPHQYIWLFLTLICLRHLMVCSIPPILFMNSKTLRKPIVKLYQRFRAGKSARVHSSETSRIATKGEFRNAIGEKVILAQSQDLYFAQLAASW